MALAAGRRWSFLPPFCCRSAAVVARFFGNNSQERFDAVVFLRVCSGARALPAPSCQLEQRGSLASRWSWELVLGGKETNLEQRGYAWWLDGTCSEPTVRRSGRP